VYKRVIKNLSKGYRQRVGFAGALIGNPPVLILDEPTVGLDPNQIIEIRTLIKNLGKHHTVILSSHILSEIEAVCDRIVIINNGKVVADDTARDLAAKYSADRRLLARIVGREAGINEVLRRVDGVAGFTCFGERENGVYEYAIEPKNGADFRMGLFNALAKAGYPLVGLKSMEMSLEEIFISLTQKNLGGTAKGGKRK
jgi:ABC-2 type transport system ATP-binding protein